MSLIKHRVGYFQRFILFLSFVLFCTAVYPQDNVSDSLKKLLSQSKQDTNRLILLNELIEISPDGVWEKYNEQLGEEANLLLKSENKKIKNCALAFKATYINNCGFIAHHNGDIQTAINSYSQSLKINEEINCKLPRNRAI